MDYKKYLISEKTYYGYTEKEVKAAIRQDKRNARKKNIRNALIMKIIDVASNHGPFKALKLVTTLLSAKNMWGLTKTIQDDLKKIEKDLKTKKVKDIEKEYDKV